MFTEAFAVSSYQDVLDTVEATLSASRQLRFEIESALSSMPIHPYERYKAGYLGLSCEPLRLDCVESPQHFCPLTCCEEISAISEMYTKNLFTQIGYLSALPPEGLAKAAEKCTAFSTLSCNDCGEQELVINKKQAANYLTFLDFVKNVPLQAIEINSEETARKLISQYITLMK